MPLRTVEIAFLRPLCPCPWLSRPTILAGSSPLSATFLPISGCPLYTRKRTSKSPTAMSAMGHERNSRALFDHLIGAREKRRRDFEAERLGGLEVYDEFEARGLLDWDVAWTDPL